MPCRLFDAKSSSKSTLAYFRLNSEEHIEIEFYLTVLFREIAFENVDYKMAAIFFLGINMLMGHTQWDEVDYSRHKSAFGIKATRVSRRLLYTHNRRTRCSTPIVDPEVSCNTTGHWSHYPDSDSCFRSPLGYHQRTGTGLSSDVGGEAKGEWITEPFTHSFPYSF